MKKTIEKKGVKLYKESGVVSKVNEPNLKMQTLQKLPVALADFPYSKFKKIADKVSFTQSEWSNILHLSERTLQRYAKDNKSFEGIYVDRILQLENLIEAGLETFTTADAFYQWLKKPKNVLGTSLSFQSLSHTQGIQDVYSQLQRIQHGVYT